MRTRALTHAGSVRASLRSPHTQARVHMLTPALLCTALTQPPIPIGASDAEAASAGLPRHRPHRGPRFLRRHRGVAPHPLRPAAVPHQQQQHSISSPGKSPGAQKGAKKEEGAALN